MIRAGVWGPARPTLIFSLRQKKGAMLWQTLDRPRRPMSSFSRCATNTQPLLLLLVLLAPLLTDQLTALFLDCLSIQELPPEEPVTAQLPDDASLVPLGKVTGIVDMLCIVTSAAEHEALDLGSVLWREDSTPLGRVRIKGRARGGWCVLCPRARGLAYPSILSPRYLTSSGPSSSPCTPCASARRQILQKQAYVVDLLGIGISSYFIVPVVCVRVRVHKMLNFRLAPCSSTDSCGRGDMLRGNRQARDNREGADIFTRKVGPGRGEYASTLLLLAFPYNSPILPTM